MSERIFLLFFILLTCNSVSIAAQETEATEPLVSVLANLQERFDVQFNYASVLVEGLQIPHSEDLPTIGKSISHLSEHTDLNYVFVSDRIISIRKKSKILCGYLKDKASGEPLPYVTLQNAAKGTISDERGFFQMEFKTGADVIAIRHAGHKPMLRQVRFFNTTSCSDIYLVPDAVQLAEIILYEYLIRGMDKLNGGSLQMDLRRFGMLPGLIEKDVLHSVQALPGIQSIDETVSNINIRGGSNDQNLISWDGIKMYQSGHFFGLISMYNPHITQKVALIKNGTSAQYTDGVSGTIAMKTEAQLNQNLKGSIGANMIATNGFVDAPLGRHASLQVAARKSISDYVRTPTYSEYFDRIARDTEIMRNAPEVKNSDIAFDFHDASFRLLFRPSDKDRLRINFIYTANEITFNEIAEVSGVEEVRQSELNQGSIAGGIQYQRDWTEKLRTSIAVYETDYRLKAINANILDGQRFWQENKVSETGIKLNVLHKIDSRIKWTNGYQLTETKVTNLDDLDDPQYRLLEAEVLRTHGLFTEMGLSSKSSDTHLNLGIRFNYLDKFGKQLCEPRLSFNHNLGYGLNLEVLGEFKHQSTSQVINFQNDFLGVEKRRWQLSDNDSIPIIRSKQASIGLSYSRKGWLANAVPFYKKVNGITTQSQGFQDRYKFVKSAGSYDAHGVDILLRKQLSGTSAWASYSYLDSTYSFDQLPEPRFPSNFDITHALSLGANCTLDRLLLAAGLNWRTGKPLTRPSPINGAHDGEVIFGNTNAYRQKDYLRLDISGQYQFDWGDTTKAQVGLAFWNLLDHNNTLNTYYRPNGNGGAKEVRQGALGLTPNLSLELIFN